MTRALPVDTGESGDPRGRRAGRGSHRLNGGSRATTYWVIGSALAGAVIMTTARIRPELPLVLTLALVLGAIAAFRPKAFALIAAIGIALAVPIQNVIGSIGSYTDEALVAIALIAFTARRLATTGGVRWLPGGFAFLVYLVFAGLSSVVQHVPLGTAFGAGYISIKGVLFAFALAQLQWSRRDLRIILRSGVVAIVVIAVLALVDLAIPGPWAQLTMHHGPFPTVAGIHPLNGPFQHPAALSRFSVILAVGCLAYLFVVRARFSVVLLLAISTGLAVLSFETKSLVGLILVAAIFALRFARVRGIVVVLCLAPLAVAALAPTLARFIGRDVTAYVVQTSARGRLTTGGAEIANQYFPFGAGLGRWGSSIAASSYSPEYVARNFQHIYGLGPGTAGQFLNDTQWPAIYGEAGWIGGVAFALGLLSMLVALMRRTSANEDVLVRWLRVAGVGWMIALIVESAVAPVFVSTPSFPFVFAAAGIIASIRRDGLLPDPIRVLRRPVDVGAAPRATATR